MSVLGDCCLRGGRSQPPPEALVLADSPAPAAPVVAYDLRPRGPGGGELPRSVSPSWVTAWARGTAHPPPRRRWGALRAGPSADHRRWQSEASLVTPPAAFVIGAHLPGIRHARRGPCFEGGLRCARGFLGDGCTGGGRGRWRFCWPPDRTWRWGDADVVYAGARSPLFSPASNLCPPRACVRGGWGGKGGG